MSAACFLPDGGTAVAEGKVRLPQLIALTEQSLFDQELKEVLPGRTMVCIELFGYMFSFLLPMKPLQIVEHFQHHAILVLTDFRVGPPQVGETGEHFRDVLCEGRP